MQAKFYLHENLLVVYNIPILELMTGIAFSKVRTFNLFKFI